MIARRCLLCCVSRSGSPGLSRILPGLVLGSVTRPERTFEVFRSTSPTDPASLRSWSSTLSSAPLRSSRLLPGPAHADLLSWGWTRPEGHPCRLCPSPLRRPSFRTPLSRSPLRVHSRIQTFAWVHRLRDATPEVPFRPRGFSPPRRLSPRYGSQACCILLPTLGFASFPARPKPRIPRDATTPRRTSPTRRGLSRHRAPWPPWCSPSCEVVTFEAVSVESIPGHRRPLPVGAALVLPGLLCPLRGFREIVFPLVRSSPGACRGNHPPSLAGKQASRLDWRDIRIHGANRRTELRPP